MPRPPRGAPRSQADVTPVNTSVKRPRTSFASDNEATVLPEALAAIAAVNHGHVPSYGHDPVTEADGGALPRALRAGRPRVSRVQRHRGERALHRSAHAAVGGGDLRPQRAPARRRVRRAGARGPQAADRRRARRQADAGGDRAADPARRRRARLPAAGRLDRAEHRAGDALPAAGDRGAGRLGARARAAAAHRRRAARQRRRGARRAAARDHHRRRRRRALVRRHEDRAARRRGGRAAARRARRKASCSGASRRCSSRRRCATSPRSSKHC